VESYLPETVLILPHGFGFVAVHFLLCSMDLGVLSLEMVEILNKITPNEDELKKFNDFSKNMRDPSTLADNDRFLFDVSISPRKSSICQMEGYRLTRW
jgi:hypothetical protein